MTFTAELAEAVNRLQVRRGEERSRLVETLLRENPLVGEEIRSIRAGPSLRKGKDPKELARLIRAARTNWDRRVKSGQVKVLDG